MTLYRIVDWNRHFENNRTRGLLHMQWVPFKNRHDGDGYTELITSKNGVSHFAAWVLIAQVASRCDPRGTLLRDAKTPHDSASLSRMTRAPQEIFENALPVLLQIGWLEEVTEIPHLGAPRTAPGCAEVTMKEGRNEGKGRERNEGNEGSEWKGMEASAVVGVERPTPTADAGTGEGDLKLAARRLAGRDHRNPDPKVEELKNRLKGATNAQL